LSLGADISAIDTKNVTCKSRAVETQATQRTL
jgi:hypothetical protein